MKVPAGQGTYKASLHSKFMVWHGPYSSIPMVDYVFTGSHNWSENALRFNWENMIKIEQQDIADQFRSHWDRCRGSVLKEIANI